MEDTTELMVNMPLLRDVLTGLALADHVGDVNNELPQLALALGITRPEWSDLRGRYLWRWDLDDDADA